MGSERTDSSYTHGLTTTIYLLRHAEMAANVPGHDAGGALALPGELLYGAFPDAPLTARGECQAERLGGRLSSAPVAAVHASPYRRAVMTAEAVARPHNLQVIVEERFVERDFGEWDGLSADEIARRNPPGVALFDSSPAFAPPGGESLEAVVARVRPALLDVTRRHAGEAVAIVSHKTAMRALLCHILGIPLQRFRSIGQDTCALNVLRISADGIDVVLINDTCHLRGLGSPCD